MSQSTGKAKTKKGDGKEEKRREEKGKNQT
jgi:hypothetical protein